MPRKLHMYFENAALEQHAHCLLHSKSGAPYWPSRSKLDIPHAWQHLLVALAQDGVILWVSLFESSIGSISMPSTGVLCTHMKSNSNSPFQGSC